MIALLCLTLFLYVYNIEAQRCPTGIKVRREWSTLSNAEQSQYVRAFKRLADQGIVQQLAELHNSGGNANAIHYVPAFFPWHRLFIYAFEYYVRQLGGEFRCFTLPYWDWTNEPTPDDVINRNERPELLRTDNQMGGEANGNCVSSGQFRRGLYDPAMDTCLRRNIEYRTDETCEFRQPSAIMDSIDATRDYNTFRNDVEYEPHANPHICIGGHMETNYSPDDPYFYLHHAFLDYIWSLWQDCNNYDRVPSNRVTSTMYNGNVNRGLYGFHSSITIGLILNNNNLGVRYAKGPFWRNARVDAQDNCGGASDPINPTWFVNGRRRLKKQYGPGRGRGRKSNRMRKDGDSLDIAEKIRDALKKQGLTKKQLTHQWAVKVCEARQKKKYGKICKMPDYFEDCSSMPLNPKTNDIDITLEELLNKKGLTDCMIKKRKKHYKWAKMTHSLKGLCDGCYDRFCDKSALKEKCAKEGKDRKDSQAIVDFGFNIEFPNNDEEPGFNNDFTDDDGFKYNDNDEKYVINVSGYYGFVIIVAVLLVLVVINIGMCYIHKNKNQKKIQYQKVSRVSDTDAI